MGQLGLGVADAQREFDVNYISRMTDFVKIANSLMNGFQCRRFRGRGNSNEVSAVALSIY